MERVIYKPGENVTRGQFAALISRTLDLPAVPQEGTRIFPDVPQDATLARISIVPVMLVL